MMNAGSKPASNSAILIFADARQLTNGIAEAHDHSILADVVRPDQRFLLSPHESTSHARPIARTALKALTWKSSGGQRRRSVACSPRLLASRRCSFRRSPISHSSARPGTTNTNDATKTSCKDSKRLRAAHCQRIARRNPTKDMPRGTCRAHCRQLGNGMPMCWRTHQKQSVRMKPWRTVRMKIRTIQEVPDFVG